MAFTLPASEAPRYRVMCRILEVDPMQFHVSVAACLEEAPARQVIARHHECSSRREAEDFQEILLDQVRQAIEALGGCEASLIQH